MEGGLWIDGSVYFRGAEHGLLDLMIRCLNCELAGSPGAELAELIHGPSDARVTRGVGVRKRGAGGAKLSGRYMYI